MEYQVLKSGSVLTPNFRFFNEEGVLVFIVIDQDTTWRGKPRPEGHYISTAWIPGNLLSEGILFVTASIGTMEPFTIHFYEDDVVAFQVVDSLAGNSARGDWTGPMAGVVRPLLDWSTRFEPEASMVRESIP
jgi:lipopolysaccharide transport system ATP-binding protein